MSLQLWWMILTIPLVEELERAKFPISDPTLRIYPDGSILVRDGSEFAVEAEDFFKGRDPWATVGTRALSQFGGDYYRIQYPGWYSAFLSKFRYTLCFGPGIAANVSNYEDEMSRVRTLVSFHRRFAKGGVEQFAAVLQKWYETTGSKGVFADEGIRSLSPDLRYSPNGVLFDFDATRSGQQTINSLTLAILNWAMLHRRPLARIDYLAGAPTDRPWADEEFEDVASSPLTLSLG